MSITAMAGRRITVKRRTALVLDPAAAAATMTPDRQPTVDVLVEVKVTGTPFPIGGITVTVDGDVGGAPDTEVLSFTASGSRATIKRFDAGSLNDFVIGGLPATVTVEARAVGSDGSREHSSYDVVTDWPARKDAGTARWPHPVAGSAATEDTRFYVDYTSVWAPRRGDVILDQRTSEEWLVVGKPEQHGGGQTTPHHWEIRVEENDGKAAA